MTRFNTLLLVILLASSLYLVKATYDARNLYTLLERARNDEHALEVDYGRLELDKRAEATPLRIEKVAREKLGMRTATPAVTQYVTYAAASLASGVAPGEARAASAMGPVKAAAPAASGAAVRRASAADEASAAASAAAFRSSQSAAIVAAAAAASQAASAAGKGARSRTASTRAAAHPPVHKSPAVATSPKAQP